MELKLGLAWASLCLIAALLAAPGALCAAGSLPEVAGGHGAAAQQQLAAPGCVWCRARRGGASRAGSCGVLAVQPCCPYRTASLYDSSGHPCCVLLCPAGGCGLGRKAWRKHCPAGRDCPPYTVCCRHREYEVREYSQGESAREVLFCWNHCSSRTCCTAGLHGAPPTHAGPLKGVQALALRVLVLALRVQVITLLALPGRLPTAALWAVTTVQATSFRRAIEQGSEVGAEGFSSLAVRRSAGPRLAL